MQQTLIRMSGQPHKAIHPLLKREAPDLMHADINDLNSLVTNLAKGTIFEPLLL